MEPRDLELLDEHASNDPELKALWDEHVTYSKLIEKLEQKPFLSPSEDLELKEMKKKKLAGKTRLQGLLEKYHKV